MYQINKYWKHYLHIGLPIVISSIVLLFLTPSSYVSGIHKLLVLLLEIMILLIILLYSKVLTNAQIENVLRKYQIKRQQICDEYRNALSYGKMSISNSFVFIRKNIFIYIIPRQELTKREKLKIKQHNAANKPCLTYWYYIEAGRLKLKIRVRNNDGLLEISNAFEEKAFRKLQTRIKNADFEFQ